MPTGIRLRLSLTTIFPGSDFGLATAARCPPSRPPGTSAPPVPAHQTPAAAGRRQSPCQPGAPAARGPPASTARPPRRTVSPTRTAPARHRRRPDESPPRQCARKHTTGHPPDADPANSALLRISGTPLPHRRSRVFASVYTRRRQDAVSAEAQAASMLVLRAAGTEFEAELRFLRPESGAAGSPRPVHGPGTHRPITPLQTGLSPESRTSALTAGSLDPRHALFWTSCRGSGNGSSADTL